MEVVQDLKDDLAKERQLQRKRNGEQAVIISERNELESIFVSCIEEVRKDMLKRRLKSEVIQKKSPQEASTETKQFEESLVQLVKLAKNKVKV